MPPKRTSTRRAGTVARSADAQSGPSYLPSITSPETNNPALPDIPVKHSFAYGASSTPFLPRKLAAKPNLGLVEVADAIDKDIKTAQDREKDMSHLNTRSRKPSASLSPVRRSRREPTPDQVQLLDSLREVTASPQLEAEHSTPTPTPPIPHTLSTTSSPATRTVANPRHGDLQAEQLYPSPLLRFGSPAREVSLSSPQFGNSVDNESLISWTVERDIHGDDLQRMHPTRAPEEPPLKNITAPPRRFSGLAFAHDTIKEEEEPESDHSAKSLSPGPVPHPQATTESVLEPESPPIALEPRPRSRSKTRSEPIQEPLVSSAPVRTIIPDRITSEASFSEALRPRREPTIPDTHIPSTFTFSRSKNLVIRIATSVLVAAVSIIAIYSFGGGLAALRSNIGSHFPWDSGMPHIDLNSTGLDALNILSNQVVRLGAQVSSLSQDVRIMRSEVDNVAAAPTTIVQRLPKVPDVPKVNFLSIGMGPIIDPYKTSPTVGRSPTMLEKAASLFFRTPRRGPMRPIAALVNWEEVGDCWCSTPRSGVSQLSVLLGRQIVPEEVVVEHIPRGATMRPEVAPANMELWAEFSVVDTSAASPGKLLPPIDPSQMPEGFSLHETVMSTLRVAYKGEPESAYSDDKLLGGSFYRIGRWKYDINAPNHIQSFELDAVIDVSAIRVGRVVFRVTSNWGANETCIYRLKLYGHT
ncbi:hypothetical protein BDV59DRAFT_115606 [Aspergillus ambiguus]|uniref:uncharacterized protein n=1 Tax=Aspergillus ambiguus TaxID=176160 RepID=UPI003CCC9681